VKRAQSLEYRSVCGSRHDGIPVPERCRRRAATSTTNLRLDRNAAIAVAWAGLIWGLFNFGFATIFSFVPSLLVERGWLIAAAGSTISIVLWLAVLSVPAGGFLADRTKCPQSILVAGCILFAILMVALPRSCQVVLTVVALGLISGLPAGPIMTLPARVQQPQTRAIGMGLFYTLYYAITPRCCSAQ